jgi:hypothetical protein
MKEFKGIKDANVLKNQAFVSLIPLNSVVPNSNDFWVSDFKKH